MSPAHWCVAACAALVLPLEAAAMDASRGACMQRLLRPGAQVKLAAMICDAQVYPTAAQRQAQAELDRKRNGTEPSEAVAEELEFRRWLRTYPRGSRQEWEASRDQEEQKRRDEQAAAYRRQLEEQQEKADLQQSSGLSQPDFRCLQSMSRREQMNADWHCKGGFVQHQLLVWRCQTIQDRIERGSNNGRRLLLPPECKGLVQVDGFRGP